VSELPPFTQLLYAVADHVATVTLNRPEKRNALSSTLVNEVIVALETARDDDAVRVVVLTGAGKAFCSGGDLSQMSGGGDDGDGGVPFRGGFVELNLALREIRKPVIAKIRRYALAGGLGLVCGCTFAIAEDTATFGTPEINRGLFPMMIMANIFRTVPIRKGLELVLLGERVTAAEAVAMGLITRAVPSDALDDAVAELAKKLVAKPPAVMKLGLEHFWAQGDMAFADALPYLSEGLMKCFATDDAREGLTAFMQKREPNWTGA
jgi:enoyl-CoA hydratase/carnithine racemase